MAARIVSRASWVQMLLLGLATGACATQTRTTSTESPGASAHGSSDERAPPSPFSTSEKERITVVQPWVRQAAQARELDVDLVNAVIWVESRFDPTARSPAGARGLMQLMPATASALAQELGWVRPRTTDPEFNVTAGSLYLAKMIARYDGDEWLGLAAYNAGPGNVDKWLRNGGLPPVSERYVELVMDARARFQALHEAPLGDTLIAEAPAVEPPAVTAEAPRNLVPEPPVTDPPPHEPEFPVRYDLDKVESTYVPTPANDPPLADTPLPREVIPPRPKPAVVHDEPAPRPAGTLPSVLDET
jgi:hypothetical protein